MVKKAKKKVVKKVVKKIPEHGFVFVGRADYQPKAYVVYEKYFELNGDPVEISDSKQAARLRRHSLFKEV